MVFIYRCRIELHDNLYFATRELGRLYETEAIVHNYALCYALGLVDSAEFGTETPEAEYRYFCPTQVPDYAVHLEKLNQVGLYVTPAKALRHSAVLNTWKYADNRYHVEMAKTQKNIPSFGRAKEIAVGSCFEFFVISQKSLVVEWLGKDRKPRIRLPRWIRLGKWASKAELKVEILSSLDAEFSESNRKASKAALEVESLPKVKVEKDQIWVCEHPLNPLDTMFVQQVMSYDTVNMPPVSLIQNVRLRGDRYAIAWPKDLPKDKQQPTVYLPVGLSYRFAP